MRDHFYLRHNGFGPRIPVSAMTDVEIAEVLRDGFEVINDDGGTFTAADLIERLRIEQVIRMYNMRRWR